jgi:cytochrome oxidase Cu insertion factor (SCO1/SenC/PrrC family)
LLLFLIGGYMTRKRLRQGTRKKAKAQQKQSSPVFLVGSLLGIVILVGAVLWLVQGADFGQETIVTEDSAIRIAPEVGAKAPDFELVNLAGEPVKLSDFQGQPVVLNFMHTW